MIMTAIGEHHVPNEGYRGGYFPVRLMNFNVSVVNAFIWDTNTCRVTTRRYRPRLAI